MKNQVTIRNSVALYDRQFLPEIMDRALSFVKEIYPTVDFDKVDFVFSGSFCRGRYYRNGKNNATYKAPTVQIPTNRDYELMYWKPSLGMYRNQVDNVGRYDVTCSIIIHELTHHAQYELGKNHGELETTANELAYFKKFVPDVYALFMNTEYKEPIEVATEVKEIEPPMTNKDSDKLNKLLVAQKRWASKAKRAETALNKLNRKIKYYQKRLNK